MNRIEIDPHDIGRVKLRVTGDNNIVIVKKLSGETVDKVSISLAGNDCSIILDSGINVGEALHIFAGQIHPNFGMINNMHIPDDCIIAGNPAKIIKTGITWDSDGSKGYVQNEDMMAKISERAALIVALPPENACPLPKKRKKDWGYRLWKHLSKKYG